MRRAVPQGDLSKDESQSWESQPSVMEKRLEEVSVDGLVLSPTSWTEIGSAPDAHPLSGAFGTEPVSARINHVAVDPTNANHIYVAPAGSGIWVISEDGSNWRPLTDQHRALSMGALAVAPANPLRIYAGTGEPSGNADTGEGRGFLVSSDGGLTWTFGQVPNNIFFCDNRPVISQIAVDPTEPNIAYAAVGYGDRKGTSWKGCPGIYKTTDGGDTWINTTSPVNDGSGSNVLDSWISDSVPESNGFPASAIYAMDVAWNGTIRYVVTGGAAIYVTIDGTKWKSRAIPSSLCSTTPLYGCNINQIVVDPNDPTGNSAYAVNGEYNGTYGQIFKTTNAGATWASVSGNLPAIPTWSLQVDNDVSRTLYVSNNEGVYSSTIPYTTWAHYAGGLPNVQGLDLKLNGNLRLLTVGTNGRGVWEALTPTSVTNVTSSTPNGTYGIASIIAIQINFNGTVNVTGIPQLSLDTIPSETVTYSSGSGSSSLTFTYTVASGDSTSGNATSGYLDTTSNSALTLNGGTISDANGNPAVLTLPTPGGLGSLSTSSQIVINGTPGPTSVAVASAAGIYGGTANLSATLTSNSVGVSGQTISLALNGTAVGSVNTDQSGVATLNGVSLAGINVGTYNSGVTASFAGTTNYSASVGANSLTVMQANQTITVTTPPPATATYHNSFPVVASSSCGLGVVYYSSGACTNSGGTYTIDKASGTCTVTITQPGNSNCAPAVPIVLSTTVVSTQVPTVSLSGAPSSAVYGSTYTLTASSTNDTAVPVITASSATCTVGTNNVNGTTVTALVTVITGVGKCQAKAVWAATPTYKSATETQTTTLVKATPTVGFTGAPSIAASGVTFAVTASSDESGSRAKAPTITASPGRACSIGPVSSIGSGNYQATVTMNANSGTCAMKASWAGSAGYSAASQTQSTMAGEPAR